MRTAERLAFMLFFAFWGAVAASFVWVHFYTTTLHYGCVPEDQEVFYDGEGYRKVPSDTPDTYCYSVIESSHVPTSE